MTDTRSRSVTGDRRALRAAYAAYLVAVLWVVLQPQAGTAGAGLRWAVDLVHALGLAGVSEVHLERALNVVLFVPLGLLGVPLFPRLPWPAWAAVGLGFSTFLEAFQGVFLEGRSATVSDLVTNTSGALLGAAVAAWWLGRRDERGSTALVVVAAVVAVVGLALVVLAPSSVGPSAVVADVSRSLRRAGAPEWFASVVLWEMVANVLLFAPLGAVGARLRPGWSLRGWLVAGVLLSGAVELVQLTLLPDRNASLLDVAMNTAGMVLGAALWRSLQPTGGR